MPMTMCVNERCLSSVSLLVFPRVLATEGVGVGERRGRFCFLSSFSSSAALNSTATNC